MAARPVPVSVRAEHDEGPVSATQSVHLPAGLTDLFPRLFFFYFFYSWFPPASALLDPGAAGQLRRRRQRIRLPRHTGQWRREGRENNAGARRASVQPRLKAAASRQPALQPVERSKLFIAPSLSPSNKKNKRQLCVIIIKHVHLYLCFKNGPYLWPGGPRVRGVHQTHTHTLQIGFCLFSQTKTPGGYKYERHIVRNLPLSLKPSWMFLFTSRAKPPTNTEINAKTRLYVAVIPPECVTLSASSAK